MVGCKAIEVPNNGEDPHRSQSMAAEDERFD